MQFIAAAQAASISQRAPPSIRLPRHSQLHLRPCQVNPTLEAPARGGNGGGEWVMKQTNKQTNTTTAKLTHPIKKWLQVLAPVLQKQVTCNQPMHALQTLCARQHLPAQTHPAGHRTGGRQSHAPAEGALQRSRGRERKRQRGACLVILDQVDEGLLLPKLQPCMLL